MVCIDNSEWTRNGDYAPTRFQAQADAVNLLAGSKTQANPENTVGVLTMAGKTPRVLVTPTPDLGKVLNCISEINVEGESNLAASVQIAQLALKHRQNRNQRQRIVIFAGSPLAEAKERLVSIAKKLKKNNVAVDIVSFGCEEENEEKLQAFYSAVNSNDNSNIVTVPPGPVLSDVLISSPIFQGEGSSGYGGGPTTAEGFEFGVDPNLDPELALALRVSLEEERARQTAAAAAAAAQASATGTEAGATAAPAADVQPGAAAPTGTAAPARVDMDMDDDALLQQALAMSMQVDEPADTTKPADATAYDAVDEELQLALELSMQDTIDTDAPAKMDTSGEASNQPGDNNNNPSK